MLSNYRHILWDWNGTLLDDRELALSIVNCMLRKRGLTSLSLDTYVSLFDHPVMDFYASIGLGPQVISTAELAHEFQLGYAAGCHACRLQVGAVDALRRVAQLGLGQTILSASQQEVLECSVSRYGVRGYFRLLLGLDNHYAHSKVELGKRWLAAQSLLPRQVLLIGDTTHDFEVAESLGCDCLLVARGHQSIARLAACGVPVLGSLLELVRCSA